jgi:hypothetical protein
LHQLIGEGAFGKYELQNFSHTERKALRWLLELRASGQLSANAQVFMHGRLPPCGGRGCRSAMSRFVYVTKIAIQYQWVNAQGVTKIWQPAKAFIFTSQTFGRVRYLLPKLPNPIPRLPKLPGGVKGNVVMVGIGLLLAANVAEAAEREAIAEGATPEEAKLVKQTVQTSMVLPESTAAALDPESKLSVPGLVVADIGTHIGVDGPGDFADWWTGRISFSEYWDRRMNPHRKTEQILDGLKSLWNYLSTPSPAPPPAPPPATPGPSSSLADIAPITGSTYTGR